MAEARTASVVVPAHDEEAGIARCLQSVLADGVPLEVVVAANGCGDATAEVASRYPVTVLDLAEPGKAGALNAGDAACSLLPRLYVDGDVVLEPGAMPALLAALDVPQARLVTPARRLDARGAGLAVRLFFRTAERLQQVRGDLLGCGVYAVNAAGRARWGAFPDGIADDYHVHASFRAHERLLVREAVSVVQAPRTLAALLVVRTRVYAGNKQHQAERGRMERDSRTWAPLLRDPLALLGLPVYVAVVVLAKRRADQQLAAGEARWGRDATGRAA